VVHISRLVVMLARHHVPNILVDIFIGDLQFLTVETIWFPSKDLNEIFSLFCLLQVEAAINTLFHDSLMLSTIAGQ